MRYDRGMGFFARAVITGFGFTLGAALFRKVSTRLGFEDPLFVAPRPPVPPPDPATGGPASGAPAPSGAS